MNILEKVVEENTSERLEDPLNCHPSNLAHHEPALLNCWLCQQFFHLLLELYSKPYPLSASMHILCAMIGSATVSKTLVSSGNYEPYEEIKA
jgi:hypothetical protein